ncbi:MAG TPA: hypothetical protein VH302_03540 [Bryobacteraceae bacterium]|nr:hypothetical protein [Bryobacteraceae bacterium]
MPPRQEYETRLNGRRERHAALQRQFVVLGNWRLVLGIVEAILAWLAFGTHTISGWLLLVPLIAFIFLVIWHAQITRRRTFAERAIRHYERAIARLEDRWRGTGNPGDRFHDPAHPYAEDLDLFGKGSLFELVANARTRAGEDRLAAWLLYPAPAVEATARQQAIQELSSRLDLREDLALLGEEVSASLDVEATRVWGTAPPVPFHPATRPAALFLAVIGVAGVIAFFAQALPLWPVLLILAVDFALIFTLRKKVDQVSSLVDTPAQSLRLVSLLLARLERESFQSARLTQIARTLRLAGIPASRRIARLSQWMDWFDSSDHILVRIIRPLLLWREQIAMGIESWRRHNGAIAVEWMQCVAEFEALSSFASLCFERPQWSFPTLLAAGPEFRAHGLQHPLLSPNACVPNDIAFDDGLRLLIVSGSNMSGKSTLLRSIGLNTVLAWAGAPVAALELEVSTLQVTTSMRVVDSLQDNRSRFYAEITRIRQILDLTRTAPPVLFLLDELLSGTNSHDRLLGAVGIVRNLLESGAIGLITTHDLALADLERDLPGRARNVHFEDRLVNGRIEFDYKLKSGIVTHSNAIELMRAVGLNV